jgi:hypothetical protein
MARETFTPQRKINAPLDVTLWFDLADRAMPVMRASVRDAYGREWIDIMSSAAKLAPRISRAQAAAHKRLRSSAKPAPVALAKA